MKRMIFGKHDEKTIEQFDRCLDIGNVVGGVLCADGHYGYSQPVGGVVVYDGQVSPSGVGYDIACGNKAVKTNMKFDDIKDSVSRIMDDVAKTISFGIGRVNNEKVDHELFDDDAWSVFKAVGKQEHDSLKEIARNQLGTVGSGNHYVDILIDIETQEVWAANHFGSRGFGHKTASGFLNLAAGRNFSDKAPGESMDQSPTLLDLHTELGQMYLAAMNLAGRYAYAGRDYVIDQVLKILGASSTYEVHNHHNFAWEEIHDGKKVVAVRKGATPLAVGQQGFIGGSMGDIAVVAEGVASNLSADAFYSTVHGAGRIMSRTQAAGKMNWKTRTRSGGLISKEQMNEAVKAFGVELRGGGTDESPFVYRKLSEVLEAHTGTLKVLHTLKPIGVCMAGADEFDPYKD
jgi:tRNA-splicing ligase RtcB (3'-phosphate/5'-hydroxy nucleic acid ligase)